MEPSIKNEISERLLGPEPNIEQNQHTFPTITINDHDHDPFQPANSAAVDFSMDPSQINSSLPLRAEAQQPEYRDAAFAIAFVFHIVVVLFLAFGWGVSALSHSNEDPTATTANDHNDDMDESSVSLTGLLWLCFLTSLASIAISAVSLQIMTHHAETLIQSSLIASCCFMGLLVVAFFLEGLTWMAIFWLVMLVVTAWYSYLVWPRIPAAAANLRTALSAIETNAGICVVAYGMAFVANLWVVVWCLALVGVNFKESSCTNGVCQNQMNAFSIVLLLLSYHWTSQVIKNVLHVTVSGVVGTWWFAPQECFSVWSPVIMDSFSRATTYSFGSICMGSLLVAIIQTLETIVRSARQRGDGGNGLLLCICKCVLHWNMVFRLTFHPNHLLLVACCSNHSLPFSGMHSSFVVKRREIFQQVGICGELCEDHTEACRTPLVLSLHGFGFCCPVRWFIRIRLPDSRKEGAGAL
jgi:hypothetical protein